MFTIQAIQPLFSKHLKSLVDLQFSSEQPPPLPSLVANLVEEIRAASISALQILEMDSATVRLGMLAILPKDFLPFFSARPRKPLFDMSPKAVFSSECLHLNSLISALAGYPMTCL